MSLGSIHALTHGLAHHYEHAEDTTKIIIGAALVAAGSDAVASLVPILSLPATIIGCLAAVWIMYSKICKKLGIRLSEHTLKLIGKAALANIAGNLIGLILALLLPGGSVIASAAVTFVSVFIAGKIFLALILKMAEKSKDKVSFSDIPDSEMKNFARSAEVSREDIDEAKGSHEEASRNPEMYTEEA